MTIVRRAWVGDLEVTAYPYGLAFGADLGNAEVEAVTLESLLADGQIESLVRRLNRGMSVGVVVEGADLADVQANEAALVAECDHRQNTFTLDLGDDYAEPMVFETTLIDPQRVTGAGSDEADAANLHQWTLAITAQPFWRSATLVTDDAGTPPSSGTVVESCDSATGWSKWSTWSGGGGSGTTITTDTAIKVEGAASVRANAEYGNINSDGSYTWGSSDQRTGLSIATGSGGYLSVRIRTTVSDRTSDGLRQLWMSTAAGEVQITNFIASARAADGFVRYVWPVDASLTVTALRFYSYQTRAAGNGSITAQVWYDDIELSAAASSEHQIIKVHQVQGSARTTASLHIASPDPAVALGQVLAITVPTDEIPAGFQPDGRRWITQGTTTADSTALGGSYLTPNTTYDSGAGYPIFDVPVGMLTAGPYRMVALVKAVSSSLTFGIQAQLRMGSSNVGPTSAAETSPTGLTTGWQFVTVGTVYLPPLPVQNADSTTKVRLLFKGAAFADVYMIPAWEIGGSSVADFSIIDCGTGTAAAGGPSSNLWIKAPSLTDPQGAWLRGPSSDGTNAQSAWPDANKPGVHTFRPGSLTHFLTSTGAAGPTSTIEYYPRNL